MRQFRGPLLIFITSLRWPRDTVEMQGIELAAIFSLLSSLFSLFSAPSSLLPSALDARNRIPAFLQGIMRPRGLLPCRNAAKRAPQQTLSVSCCCSKSLISGSLAAFFVISSLFSLLASLAAAHLSERSSHFSLRTLHQAIDSAPNSLDPLRHHSGTELLPSSALSS